MRVTSREVGSQEWADDVSWFRCGEADLVYDHATHKMYPPIPSYCRTIE